MIEYDQDVWRQSLSVFPIYTIYFAIYLLCLATIHYHSNFFPESLHDEHTHIEFRPLRPL